MGFKVNTCSSRNLEASLLALLNPLETTDRIFPDHMVLWLLPYLIRAQSCPFVYIVQPLSSLSYFPSTLHCQLVFARVLFAALETLLNIYNGSNNILTMICLAIVFVKTVQDCYGCGEVHLNSKWRHFQCVSIQVAVFSVRPTIILYCNRYFPCSHFFSQS